MRGGLLAGVCALAACGPSQDNNDANVPHDAATDAAHDATTDAAHDATPPDAVADTGPSTDAGNDATADAAIDATADAHDAAMDAGADVVDAAPDVAVDAGPDVVDAAHDASPDAPADAAHDAATDAGSDAGTSTVTPGLVVIAYNATSVGSPTTTLQIQEPHNLVANPGFETGDTTGWMPGNWAAGAGDPPVYGLYGMYSAISDYTSTTISQRVDLLAAGYTAAQLDASPTIAVRQWYRGTGQPSNLGDHYRVVVTLLNAAGTTLATYDSGMITTTGSWTAATHNFTGYPTGVRAVSIATTGQDVEFWAGHYGPAIDQSSVVLDPIEMRISNDGSTWSAWAPFSANTPWTLDSAAGTKTVYVQFRDATTMADLGTVTDTVTLAP